MNEYQKHAKEHILSCINHIWPPAGKILDKQHHSQARHITSGTTTRTSAPTVMLTCMQTNGQLLSLSAENGATHSSH